MRRRPAHAPRPATARPARRRSGLRLPNATRYARETGKSLPWWQETLLGYEEPKVKRINTFVHFSTVPRMVVYPTNQYQTPTGFYAYPLSRSLISSFATDREYAVVFRPTTDARLLRVQEYTQVEYDRDVAHLGISGRVTHGTLENAEREARVQTPGGRIWNVTRMVAKGNVVKWTKLLMWLGYDGVVDDCGGIIHSAERCQAVFFNTKALDLIDIVKKPKDVSARAMFKKRVTAKTIIDHLAFGYKAEDEPWSKALLAGADLRGLNLSNADLSGSLLSRANLSGANLSSATMSNIKAVGVDFSGAHAGDSHFFSANVSKADFRGANLTHSLMRRVVATHANFDGIVAVGVIASQANLVGARFVGAKLDQCDLSLSHADGADFRDASLVEANLSGVLMQGAILAKVDARGASVGAAKFDEADLSGATLRGARGYATSFVWSSLDHAVLRGALLDGAAFNGADMSYADMRIGSFAGSDFSGALLIGANLMGADLSRAKFGPYPMKGASIRHVKTRNTDFTGATYDMHTMFPAGFDPDDHRMILRGG